MAVVDDLFDWIQAVVGDGFALADGGLPATAMLASKKYCVVRGVGGPAPDVEDRKPRFKVVILGREKERSEKDLVRAAAEALMQACLGNSVPCGVASVRALGEPIGPSYTAEDRAWMSVDLQLIY